MQKNISNKMPIISITVFVFILSSPLNGFSDSSVDNIVKRRDTDKKNDDMVYCDEIVRPKNFFKKANEGWFSYKERDCVERSDDNKESSAKTVEKESKPIENPIKEDAQVKSPDKPRKSDFVIAMTTTDLKEFQEARERILSKAIFTQSEENMSNYIAVQYRMFELSSGFKNSWQQTLYKYPQYDYESKVSTSIMGTNIRNKLEKSQLENKLNLVSKRAGLYFIYAGGDPYSVEQAKVLKYLQSKYSNFYVYGITIDGTVLPEYQESVYNPDAARSMGVINIPSILLFYVSDKKYVTVSSFFVPIDTLEKRLYEVSSLYDNENPYYDGKDGDSVQLVNISKDIPPDIVR